MPRKEKDRSPIYLIILLALVVIAGVMMKRTAVTSAAASGGTVWESPQLISSTASHGAFIPVLRGDSSGRLLIAYNQVTDLGVENPYYRQSLDGGRSWQAPKSISQSPDDLRQVTFAFDSNDKAHAVWRTQTEIWYAGEEQWPNSATLITTTTQLVFNPDITVAPDNNLHVVWSQLDNRIYHAHSQDSGLSWKLSAPLTDELDKSDEPAVAVDQDGNIHVVWEERIYDPGLAQFRFEIRYLTGVISGTQVSWSSSATTLSTGIVEARRPAIVAQGDVVHVSFARRISDDEQYAYYVRRTNDSGWSVPLDVTQDSPVAMNSSIPFLLVPALVLCDAAPSIYFHGSLTSNGKELILGVNEADDQLLQDQVNTGDVRAIRPSLACINGTLHMVYEQIMNPNVNHQVYYLSKSGHAVLLPLIVKNK